MTSFIGPKGSTLGARVKFKSTWNRMFLFVVFLLVSILLSSCTFSSKPDPTPVKGGLRIVYLNVGQGASQLLISPSGKTMLIDAGNNDQEQVVLDDLKRYGIKRLDIVVGTHPDADHIGGLDKVIDQLDIGKVYMPRISSTTKTFESVLRSIQKKGLKVATAKSGVILDWDPQVEVKMLAPLQTYEDNNNMSAVMRVAYGKTSFLFTGDAESVSEKDMIASRQELHADVLLVGHHGSKSSTTPAFLKQVAPKYAIIQSGVDNKYGHPTPTILGRLKKAGIIVYRNDTQGIIDLSSNGTNIQITTER
ncbi:beta-lactamase superfamily II metal-dependent hydrolase [Paenibacillus shirakamiensis]|uniref:Beta-lactamase superfamily II metal-dependent hydrolase n=1 Tax=Paenibacillus shirakamiensis TaxID=1265935 RepID=A0ABS4JDY2_9BACL|nr:ComEC/Rec2 family competence protein [Paenibacillus shirakamiensis]MBP1999270.1 beta-lactamase superfamily II metal-dependent hydrolase [Paenibacillus shirakamiensis]